LSCVKGHKLPFTKTPLQAQAPHFGPAPKDFESMSKAVQELLIIGAISPCSPRPGQYLSRVFLADKPNGQKRFILNLKHLNKCIAAPHFKMEDIRTAQRLVTKHCFAASIDLKDAYFLIPVRPKDRKYLRFSLENQLFEFNCLPFGLSSAPYTFTKIMKPVTHALRKKGVVCVNYLDDFFIIGETFQECSQSVDLTVSLLTSLGFIINSRKSVLTPSTRCKFLGFLLDTNRLTLELPREKKSKIKQRVEHFKNKTSCLIQEFARFIGTLVSACPAMKYGWLYTKRFERCKQLALQANSFNFQSQMNLSSHLQSDFLWWERNIDVGYNDIKRDSFHLEIFTDASLTGWGACTETEKTHGWWTETEKLDHINYLELKAIYLALQCFTKNLANQYILIRSDNTTAVSYINRMGSVRFPKLANLARKIWRFCEVKNNFLTASYIPTGANLQADRESRTLLPDTEWSLSDNIFRQIVSHFGRPEIDLFASQHNFKCKTYFSWLRDPGATGVDAFTANWGSWYFYAFPPFCLILRTLQKIIHDKAQGILVVPYWPSQPWFPLLEKLTTDQIIFEPSTDLLYSPFSSQLRHPLANTLSVVAANVSGKPSIDAVRRNLQ
jgi:hypothetical protein